MNNIGGTTLKVAKRIKAIRLEKGLTQADVATKADLNTNHYAKVERGEIRPTVETYERIAKALKSKSSDIFPF